MTKVERAPDFLCIGAPRAGTTWLYRALSMHPEVWLPPIKELHYFDSLDPTCDEGFHLDRRLYRLRTFGRTRLGDYLKPGGVDRPGKREAPARDWRWDLRFFLGDGSESWYRSLFLDRKRRGAMVGEITPAYSIMSRALVRRVRDLNPELRCIYILRDPVERIWSNLARYARNNGIDLSLVSVEALRARVFSHTNKRRSNYLAAIDLWSEVIGSDRLFIGFYDDLDADAREFLRGIIRFLGVSDVVDSYPADVFEAAHTASRHVGAMPAWMRRELSAAYLPQLSVLAERYGDPAVKWHAKARAALDASDCDCESEASDARGS